jgi:hypothetical protein
VAREGLMAYVVMLYDDDGDDDDRIDRDALNDAND